MRTCKLNKDSEQTETRSALWYDLVAMIDRRRALGLLGGSSLAAISACSAPESQTSVPAQNYSGPPGMGRPPGGPGGPPPSEPHETIVSENGCASLSNETNGPYPADGSNRANGAVANVLLNQGVVRKDIRSSFSGMTGAADGVPMDLTISVVDVMTGCAPLKGYAVYLWHCDTVGEYSIYDVADANWLRGVGVTDANGQVTFTTIFPGCYPGRHPHFHFEVYSSLDQATHYNNRVLVSQLTTPLEITKKIYSDYSDLYGNSLRNLNNNPIETDNVFGDNNPEEIAAQTATVTGNPASRLTANVTVGMVLSS
ncbi:MAG: intradiol ring-cleavage dioxygenase [Ponticaulis sp.]|nr:intradiol ring-cleavage dioxygenase [Ponticaulis sp.]